MRGRGEARWVVLVSSLAVTACDGSRQTNLVDAGATGGTSGAGASSTGGNGATGTGSTGTGSTGAIGTTSGSTGFTGSTGTGGGSTTGTGATTGGSSTTAGTSTGAAFPLPCVWIGDVCALVDCSQATMGSTCALDGGGHGVCYGRECQDIDLSNDPDNCGAYGLVCPFASTCFDGGCPTVYCWRGVTCASDRHCESYKGCILFDCSQAPDDARCESGYCCNGSCVDLYAGDPLNCGGCGVRCPAGAACSPGGCVAVVDCTVDLDGQFCALPSGAAGECCGGACVDPTTDPKHCGDCGFTCPAGSSCGAYRQCTPGCSSDGDCAAGFACWEDKNVCVPSTCGAGSDGKSCFVPDAGLAACCGGVCSQQNDGDDPQNCGACGHQCPAGELCQLGTCQALAPHSCLANEDSCFFGDGGMGTCCGGNCVSLDDPEHCCGCDNVCPSGTACYSSPSFCGFQYSNPGTCFTDAGEYPDCDSATCPSGMACLHGYGYCVSITCDGGSSACFLDGGGREWPGYCCADACLDRGTHCTASCGESGTERTPCLYSGAQPYGVCCAGACIDIASDPFNCGDCGNVCQSGTCVFERCIDLGDPLQQDCLQSCGSGTICFGNSCVGSVCSPYQYCLAEDGTVGACCGPACTNWKNDPQNCGACGIACPAGMTCQNGFCNGVTPCGPGRLGSYCNLDGGLAFLCCPGLGCIDTSGDSANCGGCGAACPVGQSCDGGHCG